MSHYKPYPVYKDSGVEWIGRVPEHWEMLRIKRAAALRNERRNDLPNGWTYVGLEDVEPESGRYAPTKGESRQSDDSMVGVSRAGDVLYGKLRPYLRKAIVAERDGVCSTEFLVLIAGRAAATWLHCWLLTPDVTQQIEAGCYGAKMPRTDWEHVGSIPMPLPPPAEQSAIAAALDSETSRIDALIAKKTRFIELLKEKRSALITHAVTKGLDPIVKMKDSGVEWLGEVPEHWKIAPLWSVYRPVKRIGFTDEPLLSVYRDYGVVLKASRDDNRNRASDDLGPYQLVEPGQLVTNKMKTWQGSIAVSEFRGIVSPAYFIYEPIRNVFGRFIHHLMRCGPYITGYMSISKGIRVGQWDLDPDHFRVFPVLFPPKKEQERIVAFLDRETTRIDALTAKTQCSIDLLKERRSAFITAAVTGQIDLRGEIA